jgi:probable rRNA maturation factor
MKLNIENQQDLLEISENLLFKFREAIELVLEAEGFLKEVEIDLYMVDPETIQTINKEQRRMDQVTDVLSFPMLDVLKGKVHIEETDKNPENGLLMLGEIVLCSSKAIEQAKDYGHSIEREMIFLLVHAIFHLLGYDHITKEDEAEMIQKQENILFKMGLTRGSL